MVPLGPRLVLRTSCRPLAPLIFNCRAWAALATSALGFSDFTAAISVYTCVECACASSAADIEYSLVKLRKIEI